MEGKETERRKERRKKGGCLPPVKQRRKGMWKAGSLIWILNKRYLHRHGTFSRIIKSLAF